MNNQLTPKTIIKLKANQAIYLLMVLSSAICFTVGGVFMKLSQGLSQPIPSLLVYLFFIVGASIQTIAMRKAALAVTCIVVLCLESVLAFLFGVLLFQERYSYTNFVGLSFIIAGMSFLHGDDT
jgi:small multidrug resistance pump/quaternary ammonium compound-resistance protein SugE